MPNTEEPSQDKSNNNDLNDASQIPSKVEAYYEGSFKKLRQIFIIGVSFLVAVPVALSLLAHLSFDKVEKRLIEKIDKDQERLQVQIIDKQQLSLELINNAKETFTDEITNLKKQISKQQKGLLEKIENKTDSIKAELSQKTEKDLAEAMAKNYMRIATTLPDIPEQPYWRLIRNVVYIEAAVEYAKCDKQDDLKYVLEKAESEIAISKKHKKSKDLRDVYRSMYSIILRNIYGIRSIMEDKGYRDEYVFYLLDSLDQKAQNACGELAKEQKSKRFYFF